MGDAKKSGRIWIADDQIRYESQDYGSWSLPVADLRVLGEHTTDHGPWIDDWFMVFVTSSDGSWHEASVYADGNEEFRAQLARLLKVDSLHSDLAGSTEFASRVIWPQSLHGRPMFQLTPVLIPWWRRVMRFGLGEIRYELSPEVKSLAGHLPAAQP